jgi:hypothetical protein
MEESKTIMAAPVKIRILRNSIIEGHGEAKAGEEFEVSPYTAAMLASVGAAEYVTPQARGYVTTTLAPDHGDPAPRKIASAPPKVKSETGK